MLLCVCVIGEYYRVPEMLCMLTACVGGGKSKVATLKIAIATLKVALSESRDVVCV